MASTYLTPGVYVEEVASGSKTLTGPATAIAAFVGFTERAPDDDPSDPEGLKPRLVTSWTQYESLYGGFISGAMLPHSVYGFFNNGGAVCYIVRVPHTEPADEVSTVELPAVDRALGAVLEVTSKEPPDRLSVDVVRGPEPASEDDPPQLILRVIEKGDVVETFGPSSLEDLPGLVNDGSTKVAVKLQIDLKTLLADDIDLELAMIKAGTYPIPPAAPVPVPVKQKSFAGSETERSGINGLVIADEVTMVIVPDLVTAATKEDGSIDLNMWKSVQTAMITHCEQQANRMAILDAPPGMNPQQIKEWRSDVAMYDSTFAAMYYPWIQVDNPAASNGDTEIMVPPSGHLAGLWARVDDSRGVHKAPANEIIRGALDVERPITHAEQGLLNPIGINCIRPFGTRGIRVWGARTLTSDTDWTYIPVRRLFNMIETAIMQGTQWVVFEPNDVRLWDAVRRTVSAYLRGLWRDGALFGTSEEQAFFVRCDESTNPPDSIDQGKLVVEVGIAPVKPAEFVIFRVSQYKDTAE